MKGTFTVAGQRVSTSSQRRFVLFLVYLKADSTWGIEIYKRTDSSMKARRMVADYGFSTTRKLVVIDTVTGEQI